MTLARLLFLSFSLALSVRPLRSQELPYFVTYSHHLEEPGSLEVEIKTVSGHPPDGNRFSGNSFEFEYGVRGWWTSEIYLDTQSTSHESTLFTGVRFENRFRPLLREHVVNPVLYIEFGNISGANKSLLEVVGHDGAADLTENNAATRAETKREVELKLILSSNARGWNFAENVIAEKNLKHAPWEFGYAVAATRPLRLKASARECSFCASNLQLGVEMYGGLGDTQSLGTHNTSHYVAPTMNWALPSGTSLLFSYGFGLNDYSLPHIVRFGMAYEVGQLGRFIRPAHRAATRGAE